MVVIKILSRTDISAALVAGIFIVGTVSKNFSKTGNKDYSAFNTMFKLAGSLIRPRSHHPIPATELKLMYIQTICLLFVDAAVIMLQNLCGLSEQKGKYLRMVARASSTSKKTGWCFVHACCDRFLRMAHSVVSPRLLIRPA